MNLMKPIRTTISAFGKSKPAGARIITDHHQLNDFRAENYEIGEDFNRFEATDIIARCGRKMPPSDSGQRWTSALITHIVMLVKMTQDRDWLDRKPIVWMSVAKTAQRLGISCSQVNRQENKLMELGAITWDDSGNHKRFGRRNADGRIIEAYGINLAPLAAMLETLREHDKTIFCAELEWGTKRNSLISLRSKCRRYLLGLDEDNDIIVALADECNAILASIHLHANTDIPTLDGWIAALDAWIEKLKKQPVEPARTKPVDNARKSAKVTAKMRPKESKSATPGSHPCDAHTIQHESHDINTHTCSGEVVDNASGAAGASASAGYCQKGGRRRSDDAPPERLAEEAETDAIIYQLDPARLFERMPPNLAAEIGIDYEDTRWEDVANAALRLLVRLGISDQAWASAVRQMGKDGAALAVILIAWRRELGEVYSPGGYLRGMTKKAQKGELNLVPSFYGLQKRGRKR